MTAAARDLRPRMRLDSVQLLRAVAAVTVVTHHIRLFANGEWGVDLFFVISGFIMCYVTAESARHFFTKRLIRVVPLYWAGTLAVFAVALAAPTLLTHTTTSLADLAKSLAFIPFKKGDKTVPVLFLGWTLNYEMFFYLLFALSMAASHRHRALIASTVLIVMVVAGQVFDIGWVPLRFLTQPIVLEFAFGMLCYTFFMRDSVHSEARRATASRIAWTALGAMLIACMPFATFIAPYEDRIIKWGILAALGFYCVVHGLLGLKLPRAWVLIGDASYSLYLFHPYVIQIFTKVFGAFTGNGVYAYCMAAVVIALCCGLAVLSYTYLEKPISEVLRRKFVDDAPRAAVAVNQPVSRN
jgi:exopolysaccharide production protein ExoZ